jgi:hypothetical protein
MTQIPTIEYHTSIPTYNILKSRNERSYDTNLMITGHATHYKIDNES